MGNFLIGTVLTAGSALLLGSGGRSQTNRQTVERNKQNNFNEPRSSYGDYIPKIWGWGRVSGILIYNLLPPLEEVSVAVTEETQTSSSGGKGGSRSTTTTVTEEKTYSYYGDAAWIISQRISSDALKEIRLNGRLFWKEGSMDAKYASQGCIMRFKEGSSTQTKDELLQEISDHHNYRHRGMIVIERLPLEFFGNNYPQISVIIKNGEPLLSEIITDICLDSPNLSVNDIDVSELTDVTVSGFQIDNESSLIENLSKLAQIYLFDVVDSEGKIKFRKQYRSESSVLVPFNHMGTKTPDGESSYRYQESYNNKSELPSQYEVKFLDVNNNLQPAVERSPIIRDHNQNTVTVDFSGALSADQARTIANQLLWLAWERSVTQSFTLPLRYAVLEPGDVIDVPIDGVQQLVQVQEIALSVSNLVSVKTWKYRAKAFNFAYTSPDRISLSDTATINTPIAVSPSSLYSVVSVSSGETTFTEEVDYTVDLSAGTITPISGGAINNGDQLDIVATTPEQPRNTPLFIPSNTTLKVVESYRAYPTDAKGIYVFGDGDQNWHNASIYASRDNENNYRYQGALVARSVFGHCDTVLGNHNDIDVVDTTNSLDITVPNHAELASISVEEFEKGFNRALVGNEIIDFQNATLLGTDGQGNNQYRLDTFNRGLSCTFDQLANHNVNEEFYLLSGYKLIVPGRADDVGKTIYFKAVSLGQTLDDVTAVSLVIQGLGAKALQPVITGFSPTQSQPGNTIKIFGEGFANVTSVEFNELAAASFTIDFDNQISAIIATGTTTGKIKVSTPQGFGESVTELVIGNIVWGNIGGTLANQSDLQTALNAKLNQLITYNNNLTTTLELTNSSNYFQQHNPQNTDQVIVLPLSPTTEPLTAFEILNLGNGNLSLDIKETINGSIVLRLNSTTKYREVRIRYNGVQWVSNYTGWYE